MTERPINRYTIHRVEKFDDGHGESSTATGYTIDALHEVGAAQALVAATEHFGFGTLEARDANGTVVARVNVEVFEQEEA